MNFHVSRLRTVLEFCLYAALTALMLHATWLTWPDAFIDFSRELYLPWRVSCGDLLYRDLAYYYGPLSVYANAALFAIIGHPSIHALFVFNFAFWLATLLALRAILRRIASPAAATAAIASFILLFSFNRYLPTGNYNYLAPYSHELPRGLLLSLLSLLSLDSALGKPPSPSTLLPPSPPPRGGSRPQAGWGRLHNPLSPLFSLPLPLLLLLSGFLLGLALFTKPEIALAATASSACLWLFARWGRGRPARSDRIPAVSWFASGILAALAAVLLPLALALGSFRQALHDGLFRLYLDALDPALSSLPFFKTVLGTDDIPSHILRLLLGATLAAAPFLLARAVLLLNPSRLFRLVTLTILSLSAAAIGFFAFYPLNAALPLAPILLLFSTSRQALSKLPLPPPSSLPGSLSEGAPGRRLGGGAPAQPHALPFPAPPPLAFAFSVFSLALMAKMPLNASIMHYGFVLALPAFCCAILLLIPSSHFHFSLQAPSPRGLPALGRVGETPQSPSPPLASPIPKFPFLFPLSPLALALLLAFSGRALAIQHSTIRGAAFVPVARGGYRVPATLAPYLERTLDWIDRNLPPSATLAVIPEGAVLNVLSGHPASNPFFMLEQGTYLRSGETAVLGAFRSSPPDCLLLVRKDLIVQPEPRFGFDYAEPLMAFLDANYTPVLTLPVKTPSGIQPFFLLALHTPPS